MFNSIAIVNVTSWNNAESDKNGATPVLLKAIAGTSINKSILAGTLASSLGFELNKSYMVQIDEKEANEYGRQFSFTNLGEQSGVDLIRAIKELGKPSITKVTEAASAFDATDKVVLAANLAEAANV